MAHRFKIAIPPTFDAESFAAVSQLSPDDLPSIALGLADDLQARSRPETDPQPRAGISAVPMAAAPFVWREDGRPNWGAMWTTFCDLALFGGPPHRPPEAAVRAAPEAQTCGIPSDAIDEMRRGIWETAHLFSEPAETGWLAVTCRSPKMAEWLSAAIVLENVEARCDGLRLLVPASGSFALETDVKSVITVLAKTVHYWEEHIAWR